LLFRPIGKEDIEADHKAGKNPSKAARTFKSLYESNNDCPENFIMQLAFTCRNSFLLTTDGRVFGWGEPSSMLGKDKDHEDQKHDDDDHSNDDATSAISGDGGHDGDNGNDKSNLTEINFTNKRGKALIVAIATGRNHALALDIQGNVFSWGNNKYGQLGCGEEEEISENGKDKHDRTKDGSRKGDRDESTISRNKMSKIEFISKPKQVLGELM